MSDDEIVVTLAEHRELLERYLNTVSYAHGLRKQLDAQLVDMSAPNEQTIGDIGNFYGGLAVKAEDGKCYWSIEDVDGHDWQPIPESLYRALVEYQSARKSPNSQINEQTSDT